MQAVRQDLVSSHARDSEPSRFQNPRTQSKVGYEAASV
jgi:hypothetical protein